MYKIRTLNIIIYSLSLFLTVSVILFYFGFPVVNKSTPNFAVASAAIDLANFGTWNSTYFYKTYWEIASKAKSTNLPFWQDVFALGVDGKLYPKHSPFSIFVGAIFYSLFGQNGFWICQQLFSVSLVVFLFQFTKSLNPEVKAPTFFAALVLGCFGLFLGQSYSFSYDLHFAWLIILSCMLLKKFSLLAGFVCGLSFFIRPTALLFLPSVLMSLGTQPPRSKVIRCLLGFVISMSGFLFMNWNWFGNPFVTSYHRLYDISPDGGFIQSYHPNLPSPLLFFQSIEHRLFDFDDGIFPLNLATLIFIFITLKLRRSLLLIPESKVAIASLIPVAYFLMYHFNEGVYASRFYITSALLCVPLMCRYWQIPHKENN